MIAASSDDGVVGGATGGSADGARCGGRRRPRRRGGRARRRLRRRRRRLGGPRRGRRFLRRPGAGEEPGRDLAPDEQRGEAEEHRDDRGDAEEGERQLGRTSGRNLHAHGRRRGRRPQRRRLQRQLRRRRSRGQRRRHGRPRSGGRSRLRGIGELTGRRRRRRPDGAAAGAWSGVPGRLDLGLHRLRFGVVRVQAEGLGDGAHRGVEGAALQRLAGLGESGGDPPLPILFLFAAVGRALDLLAQLGDLGRVRRDLLRPHQPLAGLGQRAGGEPGPRLADRFRQLALGPRLRDLRAHLAQPRMPGRRLRRELQLLPRPRVVAGGERRVDRREVPGDAIGGGAGRRRRSRRDDLHAARRRRRHHHRAAVAGLGLETLDDAHELGLHRAEILVAIGRVLGQRLVDDGGGGGVDQRIEHGQRRRLVAQDLHQHGRLRLGLERLAVDEQLVEDQPHREDVAAVIDGVAAHLLRRHVVRRADDHADLRQPRLAGAGDPEIQDLQDVRVAAENQVGRLDVAVDDAVLVGEGEAAADLDDQLDALARVERSAPPDQLGQRLARDVLHGDERLAVVLADVVDGDDVRVLQPRRQPRLALEALADVGVVDAQHLDRDEAIDGRVEGQEQRAHAALAEALADAIAIDGLGQLHGVRVMSRAASRSDCAAVTSPASSRRLARDR